MWQWNNSEATEKNWDYSFQIGDSAHSVKKRLTEIVSPVDSLLMSVQIETPEMPRGVYEYFLVCSERDNLNKKPVALEDLLRDFRSLWECPVNTYLF